MARPSRLVKASLATLSWHSLIRAEGANIESHQRSTNPNVLDKISLRLLRLAEKRGGRPVSTVMTEGKSLIKGIRNDPSKTGLFIPDSVRISRCLLVFASILACLVAILSLDSLSFTDRMIGFIILAGVTLFGLNWVSGGEWDALSQLLAAKEAQDQSSSCGSGCSSGNGCSSDSGCSSGCGGGGGGD